MAATLAPRAVIENASPTSRKPGFARPMTNPSYQRIVFSRRRSSTATSAILRLLEVDESGEDDAATVRKWGESVNGRGPATPDYTSSDSGVDVPLSLPLTIRCECGHTSYVEAGR